MILFEARIRTISKKTFTSTYSGKFLSYDGESSKITPLWEVARAEISLDFWEKSTNAPGSAAGGHLKDGRELATWRNAEPPAREKSDSHICIFFSKRGYFHHAPQIFWILKTRTPVRRPTCRRSFSETTLVMASIQSIVGLVHDPYPSARSEFALDRSPLGEVSVA